MRRTRKVFLLLLSLTLIIPQQVHAYSKLGYKWNKTTIKYYTVYGELMAGAQAWTGLDAGLQYSTTYYDVLCEIASEPNAVWDGACTHRIAGSYFSSAHITLNSGYARTWNDKAALKSVAVHEFGHVLGLGDLTGSKAIMNGCTWGTSSRYETFKLTAPQEDDKSGVNSIY